ncbi:putative ATP-dependent RNA helicase [Lachancea thermotolerans CBS 6340]|uniref:ATP-dependent RNA helicase n=1 Tax=Lachancea thermotolerans (strain ATCC 56472 / CBS 6340 / NRRL Y-8284) TaxID=559295 RepID=C5DG85_LACTC|nr:KLTH0D03190p [Lachancea thermotolerans CBS 6340]CAR22427.1 KLTH0D03190p [Lachancea thermotolerans CBS 6340]
MSDDDGMMLLNLDTTSSVDQTPGKVKVSGGRWKDRRKAKAMLNGKSVNSKDDRLVTSGSVKRPVSTEQGVEERKEQPARKQAKKVQIKATPADQQIVSSLFTSNRGIVTSINNNVHDENSGVGPSNAPLLQDSFEALGITSPLLQHLSEVMHITKPTRVQKMSIPTLLEADNDVFVHAQTGSGKTLAFLLPILSRILSMGARVDRQSGCFGMIITPTRELASQIHSVMLTLTKCCHYLIPCLLIGGERKKSEKARLRKGCNFIIGTPGRILDHLQNTQVIKEQLSSSLRYLVLDEGDKLMELGFEETITQIIKFLYEVPLNHFKYPELPKRIIHVLCSATLKGGVNKLGNLALQDYKLISSGRKQQEVNTVPDQLIQKIVMVPPKLRLVTLAAELNNITVRHLASETGETRRTIVFLSCSDSVEFHYAAFSSDSGHGRALVGDSVKVLSGNSTSLPCLADVSQPSVVCYKLHGSLSQQIRTATLKSFSSDSDATKGKHLIMFCTDVASRGLDLPCVSSVIEMDPPFAVEDHLHRIGRTARAGVSGESLLFLLPGEEEGYMDHIKPHHPQGWKLLKYDVDILKPAFMESKVQRSDGVSGKPISDEWDNNATTWHLNIERRVLGDPTFKEIAAKGYTSHIRAYATHLSQEKKFFSIKCLHLGHLAKSFALRERPKVMGGMNAKNSANGEQKKPKETSKSKMLRMAKKALDQSMSEFNY